MTTYKHLQELINHFFTFKYVVAHILDDLEAIEESMYNEGRNTLTEEEREFVIHRLEYYADGMREPKLYTQAVATLR